jgi:putative ABC transport system permease protein
MWRKRGRAVLMLLQIASAFALFGLLEGINTGIKQAIAQTHRDRLYIASSVSLGDPLPISLLARIRATPGVAVVTPRQGLPGTYQQPDQQLGVIGIEPRAFFEIHDEYSVAQEAIAALEGNRTGTLVGRDSMERFGWKLADRVVLQSPVPRNDGSRDWTFDIVGSYEMDDEAAEANALIANFAYVDEARLANRDTVQVFVAKIDDPTSASAVGLTIDNAFANSDHETRTQSEADLAASQIQRIGDLNYLARMIIAAVFFAMLFATGALMMQSIRERMPELAVLKTVGFTDGLVMALIVTEAVVFCLFAAGVGLAIATLVLPAARSFIGIAGVPPVVVAAGLALALALALIGSSVPAWRGLKLQVVDALAGR